MKYKNKLGLLGVILISCLLSSVNLQPATVSASSLSTTTLVTTGMNGTGANRWSLQRTKTLSHDGNIAVFATSASNIVPSDRNENFDVFAYNRITKSTELISANAAGEPANLQSGNPTISADGRYVAYSTTSSNILPLPEGCSASSTCSNMIVHDRWTDTKVFANVGIDGNPLFGVNGSESAISADGHSVVFTTADPGSPHDTNNEDDVYIHNLQTKVTKLVSVDNAGQVGNGVSSGHSLSADGRYVVFQTNTRIVPQDTNAGTDIYVRDTHLGTTSLVSVGLTAGIMKNGSYSGVISDDGHSVVFLSDAPYLVPNDTNDKRDVFVRDLRTGVTKRINVANNGTQTNGYSQEANISSDGRFIVYSSQATNLVPWDTGSEQDVFLYDSSIGLTRRINRASHDGVFASSGLSRGAIISGDGRAIMFVSDAANLTSITPSPSGVDNVYLAYNPVVNIPFYDPGDLLELFSD